MVVAFRSVGASDLVVSSIGLGTSNLGISLDLDASRRVVHTALDCGVTLFDTADSYGASEERLGQLLKGHRANVVVATKFGSNVRPRGNDNGFDCDARGSRRYIQSAVEGSLRRLRTDWIDVYQLHKPDPLTPITETLSALDDLVRAGKVRYIGHSNMTAAQVAEADAAARNGGYARCISTQASYSLLDRRVEADLMPQLDRLGIGLLAYFPLASGLLTGKYHRGETPPRGSRAETWGLDSAYDPNVQNALFASTPREQAAGDRLFDTVEQLRELARRSGATLLEFALGGLLAQPAVATVIVGATSEQQVRDNVAAAAFEPTPDVLAAIDRITLAQ